MNSLGKKSSIFSLSLRNLVATIYIILTLKTYRKEELRNGKIFHSWLASLLNCDFV